MKLKSLFKGMVLSIPLLLEKPQLFDPRGQSFIDPL